MAQGSLIVGTLSLLGRLVRMPLSLLTVSSHHHPKTRLCETLLVSALLPVNRDPAASATGSLSAESRETAWLMGDKLIVPSQYSCSRLTVSPNGRGVGVISLPSPVTWAVHVLPKGTPHIPV